MAKRWTAEEEELALKLWHEGKSIKSIAHELGMTYAEVQRAVAENRQDFPQRGPWSTPMERQGVCELRSQGKTVAQIAERCNRAESTVRRWLHSAGVA